MKKNMSKLMSKILYIAGKYSACALAIAAVTVAAEASTRCCTYALHQPEVPAEVKKYRKF